MGAARGSEKAHPGPGPAGVQEPAREDGHTSRCTETHTARPRPPARFDEPAARYDVGRVLATGESCTRPAHYKVGTKPRRSSEPSTAA